MGSRSKLILELATKNNVKSAENLNIMVPPKINAINASVNEIVDTHESLSSTVSHRRRSESSSSSSRSSSSSSSSDSSASSSSSCHEDSDDSVRDPDYQVEQRKPTFTFTMDEFDKNQSPNVVNKQANDQNEESTATSINITDSHESTPLVYTNEQNITTENETTNETIEDVPSLVQKSAVEIEAETPTKKGEKRPRQEGNWKKNIAKKLRNSGRSYRSSKTSKEMPERKLKPTCKETCKFKCQSKITETQRQELLKDYWKLGSIERQWSFIIQSMEEVKPVHRYVRVDENGTPAPKRESNNAFFFIVNVNGEKIRVCKKFFVNTLAINNRPIETALKKKNKNTNISLIKDNRGCHSKHVHVDDALKKAAKDFIESIPKIESLYMRANSKKHYIDGSKTISDINRDYVEQCKAKNVGYVNYIMFYRIFTQEFNISFFIPKKDACEFSEAYKNCTDEEKELKKESYLQHHQEKQLSRAAKENDKKDDKVVVAVFDLQAVFQCPKGDISVFYYKSKLNVLNLTIYDLKTNSVECYVWDESQAPRGVNEIATCVFKYLRKISEANEPIDVIFYSDNCAGQQKNRFMMAMYSYAVQKLPNIKSITHKFLIKGHTQNEGDSAHSQIERQVKRQLRSGPIYTPEGFIGVIKAARKKSKPMHVNEICFSDILDWKAATSQMNFVIQKDEDKNTIKLTEIKAFKVQKDDPEALYYKTTYTQEFKRAVVIKKSSSLDFRLKQAFDSKPGLAENKKKDLRALLDSNHIPGFYRPFIESL